MFAAQLQQPSCNACHGGGDLMLMLLFFSMSELIVSMGEHIIKWHALKWHAAA
jgi:hypothetical protein